MASAESLTEMLADLGLTTATLSDIASSEKEKNKDAFRVKIDPTASFVCQPSSLELNGTDPTCPKDLVEAADLFEFCKLDGSSLHLTSLQTEVRDHLLEHVYHVLYSKNFSAGAGRLVLGRKGAAKTTTLMMVQAILSALLPNKFIVFFCSAAQYPDVIALFEEASGVRLAADKPSVAGADELSRAGAGWTTAENLKASLTANKGKFIAFVDEYQSAYAKDTKWRDMAHSFGQQTSFGTFILTGSAPYLRALAFGHAEKKNVEGTFPYYEKAGNLNNSRYDVINMEPKTTKESYAELAGVCGVQRAGQLLDIDDDEWLTLLGMATGGLPRGMETITRAVTTLCDNAQTALRQSLQVQRTDTEKDELKHTIGEAKTKLSELKEWAELGIAEKVTRLLALRPYSVLWEGMDLPTTMQMGFNTRFTEVEKHMEGDKKLLKKLGKLLEAQAQTKQVDRLLGVPWQLMSSVPARQLRDDSEIGARMLYAASDRGAIRYDGDTVSFGSPMLAQSVLEEMSEFPDWFSPRMRLYLRYVVEFGRQAEVVVRACWAEKAFGTTNFDKDNHHVLCHEVNKGSSWLMRAGGLALDWKALGEFRHVVDEVPDVRGCDVAWFTVSGKEVTIHRCQVKLGLNGGRPVGPAEVMKWRDLLAGVSAHKGESPFDEAGRKAFEKGLQNGSGDNDVKVKVKLYLVMTRPLTNAAELATELAGKNTSNFTFELWHHDKCVDQLWLKAIVGWAERQGLAAYYKQNK